jgi:hypothetical protein
MSRSGRDGDAVSAKEGREPRQERSTESVISRFRAKRRPIMSRYRNVTPRALPGTVRSPDNYVIKPNVESAKTSIYFVNTFPSTFPLHL